LSALLTHEGKADEDQMNFVQHLWIAARSGAMTWIDPVPDFKR